MRSPSLSEDFSSLSPSEGAIAFLEKAAIARGWESEKPEPGEIILHARGEWHTYTLHVCHPPDFPGLLLLCKFDFRVPEAYHSTVQEVLSSASRELWMGHFEFACSEDLCLFRHSLPLPKGQAPTGEQLVLMAGTAFRECEDLCPKLLRALFGPSFSHHAKGAYESGFLSPFSGKA